MNKSIARPLITLTTDFGTHNSYVAQMKGVILSRNPDARIVDVTHGIAPQDVWEGALVLGDVCGRFPQHTIHVTVVDPGVGTDRRIVCATIGGQFFVCPDNGLLTIVAQHGPVTQVVAVTKRTYFLPEVSGTFEGRDIMAPVAAHLSLGLNPRRLGALVEPASLVTLPLPRPAVTAGCVHGEVIYIDSFGNLITNIEATDLASVPETSVVTVECLGEQIRGISRSYGCGAPGDLLAIVGSAGRLEVAEVQGSGARRLAARRHAAVTVRW